MESKFYLNGQDVQAPILTKLEKKLAAKLAIEDFGDNDSNGYITLSDSQLCSSAGLERVNEIEWDGSRQQLGALVTSLQDKNLIAVDDPDDGFGIELWFDCDVLELLSK